MCAQAQQPPGKHGLSDAAEKRFLELQASLTKQWKLIQSMNQLEQTMVVVPSFPPESEEETTYGQAREERLLFLLFLLRKPRARIVYLTSLPLPGFLIDYYLGLLPGIIASHARARLKLVAVNDAAARPLTTKILQRPRLIERIRSLITDPTTTHMVPLTTTSLEKELALRLGIPVYSADPSFAQLQSLTGSRTLFAEEGIPHLRHVAVSGRGEVAEALATLAALEPAIAQARVLPSTQGGSGVVSLTDLGQEPDHELNTRLKRMHCTDTVAEPEGVLRLLDDAGGIVEEVVVSPALRTSSVELRISPLGRVELLSTHDVTTPTGNELSGERYRFPADPAYVATITQAARKVGDRLCREGVLGRASIGFVVTQEQGGWNAYAHSIDFAKGSSTVGFLTLEFLTNGHYDATTGVFTTPQGNAKHYLASDWVSSPAFCAIQVEDLFDIVVRHGLQFDHTTQSGVVLNMLSALTELGRFGLTAVADTPEEAIELHDRAVATLSFEAERAAQDPGIPEI